ncbi:hypothetical protein [Xanthomonas sp. WHRI 7945]
MSSILYRLERIDALGFSASPFRQVYLPGTPFADLPTRFESASGSYRRFPHSPIMLRRTGRPTCQMATQALPTSFSFENSIAAQLHLI